MAKLVAAPEKKQASRSLVPASPGLFQHASAHGEHPAAPPMVHEALRSSGEPLDAHTRTSMESRFGHDFSRVRVHTDSTAAESAKTVNALAYTLGNNIAFGAGQYTPG